MKARLTLLLALTLGFFQFAPMASPQSPSEKAPRHLRMERRAHWANLSEDDRAKIRAAHQKAMTDPQVKAAHEKLKQARRDFRDVMRPAMVKADPSIQVILEKLFAERTAGE